MNPEVPPSSGVDLVSRQRLLRLARLHFEARVRHEPSPPVERGGVLDLPRGAFVTIHAAGELRGCLGRLSPLPLGEAVAALAASVADSDPRFPPVTVSELAGTTIEISVLTPEREVARIEEIEVGRHGLIVEQGSCRGLLLPQVAGERGWDRRVFVQQTCRKAGLPPDAWTQGARLFLFEAEVFGDG